MGFIILFGCKNDGSTELDCDTIDEARIIGVWSEPEFIVNSGNCYKEECLDIEFILNADATYQLHYQVSDLSTDTIQRKVEDQGIFSFTCQEAGNLAGRFSALRYVKGEIILDSDSLEQMTWKLEWNGIEGLIILPEYLGFSHNVSVNLNK